MLDYQQLKIPNIFIPISTLLSLFNYIQIMKFLSKFLKRILGPYYRTIIPFVFGMIYIFRKSLKLFLVINIIIALYINQFLSIPIDLSYDLLLDILYSMYLNVTDYVYYLLHKSIWFIKNIFANISDYFNSKQESIDYKRYRFIKYDPVLSNERMKLPSEISPAIKEQIVNDYIKQNYFYDEDWYISKKAVYIALALGIVIIGGIIYYQDPTYYNNTIYSGYTAIKDYVCSFFWDRDNHPKPDSPKLPPLDNEWTTRSGDTTFRGIKTPSNPSTNPPAPRSYPFFNFYLQQILKKKKVF